MLSMNLKRVSYWGTLCGVFAMLVFVTGCPFANPCTSFDPDDGDLCTVDTCELDADNNPVAVNTPVECAEGEVCDPETGECVDLCADVVCDDDDVCTDDACDTATGECVYTNNTAACDDGDLCTDDDVCSGGVCAGTAVDCDDGLFCTGVETCDEATGDCVSAGDPCDPDTQECDEATGTCIDICDVDADCDDDVFCNGVEVCVDGICEAGDDPCPDDGLYCNGDEACSEETDACYHTGDPCVPDACDDENDGCIPGTPCTTDADCEDDGLYCTGVESCDTDLGVCVASGDPCTAPETCDEDLNECTEAPGEHIYFTLGVDDLSGTGGNDMFDAPVEFNAPTGTSIPTFQTSDAANGGDGDDELNADFNLAAAATVNATLTSIETLNFTDLGTAATTINGTNFTGVTNVNSISGTNGIALIVNNLKNVVDVGLETSAGGVNVGFTTAATSGTADAMNMSFTNITATEGTCAGGANAGEPCLVDAAQDCPGSTCNNETTALMTLTSGTTNGVETLNVSVSGACEVGAIAQATGTSLTTVNFSGSGSLRIPTAWGNNVVTFDACGTGDTCTNTGGVDILFGAGGTITATGGSGNDAFRFSAADFTVADTLDGKGGTNTLSLLSADADNAQTEALTNISNFQTMTISDALAAAAGTPVKTVYHGTITTVNLPLGSTNGNIQVESGTTINFGKRGAAKDSAGTFGASITGLATTDSLTMNLYDSDFVGAVTLTGVETLNLNSYRDYDGSAADGGTGVNDFGAAFTMPDSPGVSVLVAGDEAISFTGAVTARSINAGSFAHDFTMALATPTVATGGTTITTGSGNDTIEGSAGTDSLSSGTGNDVIQPGAGIDSANVGTGSDILDLEDLAAAALLAANRVTCSGMTIDGTTYSATNETDAIRFGNVTDDGDLSDGAAATELQVVTTPVAAPTYNGTAAIMELSWEFSAGVDLDAAGGLDGTLLLSACGATSGTTACVPAVNTDGDDLIMIAYQSGNAYIYFIQEDADVDTNIDDAADFKLVAIINGGVTVGGFVNSNFQ